MSQLHQSARQGLEHIRESAGLRVRQSFRSCKENAHRFSAKFLRYRRYRLASTSFVAKSLLGFLLSPQFSCLSDFLRNRPSRPRMAKLLIDWQITSSWPDRNLDNIF